MKSFKINFVGLLTIILFCGNGCREQTPVLASNKVFVAENGEVQIFREVVGSADPSPGVAPVVAIWVMDKATGEENKLLQTVNHAGNCWYVADGKQAVEIPIDSLYAASNVYLIRDKPLKLIVEGCPDYRNIYSYIVDVEERKAWYIPANSGYLGSTSEEGFLIFQSYRYVSDPDVAGRYTFLHIFDENGTMVESLDLVHLVH